ncbi:major vault -like, partial [Brachionus plicatilis]
MANVNANSVYRIAPYQYIHVLDQNLNVTRLEIGPKTFVKQDNEKVVLGPEKMITIPPRHYCVVENPALKDKENKIQFDQSGQVKLAFAELEIRFAREPFPLYPGETLKQNITPLRVL